MRYELKTRRDGYTYTIYVWYGWNVCVMCIAKYALGFGFGMKMRLILKMYIEVL